MIIQRKPIAKASSSILFVMLVAPLFSASSYAQVFQQTDCSAPLTTSIDANYNGPVAIDAYWVDQGVSVANATSNNPAKKEVGPGEGASVFAVVLNNKGSTTLSSITGFLNLPSGFEPTGESMIPQLLQTYNPASKVVNNEALASYYGNVSPGSTFILYFNVIVQNTAKIGTYSTHLVVNYNIGIGTGSTIQHCTSAVLEVPFVLPGKVIMDISSDNNGIAPSKADPITINILNKGSADATGVVATIVNLGNNKGGTVPGSSGGSLVLQSSQTNIVNLGANTFSLGKIPANGSAQISTTVFPSSSAAGSTQEVQIQLTYESAWGKLMNAVLNTGLPILPNAPQSLSLVYLGSSTSPIITAGNLADLNFAVANNSTDQASNVVISLVPQSSSLSVVGQSTWTIPKMEPGERQFLSTKVFAATSLINTPVSFTLTATYLSKDQTQSNSLTLGAFVIGNIKIQLYDVAVNYVGNTPTVVGNLLNQGSTTALFTTIQLAPSALLDAITQSRFLNSTLNNATAENNLTLQQAQADSPLKIKHDIHHMEKVTRQFLGDLTADSPIPFSMPLRGINHLEPGIYPASFEITYADDLKNSHELILNATVNVGKNPQLQNNGAAQQISLADIPLPLIMGASIAVIAGIAAIIRRNRSSKQKMLIQSGTDIVAALEGSKKENEP